MKINPSNTKYGVITSSKFNKQLKKSIKQGKKIEKLSSIVKQLANGKTNIKMIKSFYI